ncbi:MAG: hypothetical protein LBT00_13155 [Spirochaetaceae bacterium]|nr:hypothetical protein [Spirochaetaceae bacterium]
MVNGKCRHCETRSGEAIQAEKAFSPDCFPRSHERLARNDWPARFARMENAVIARREAAKQSRRRRHSHRIASRPLYERLASFPSFSIIHFQFPRNGECRHCEARSGEAIQMEKTFSPDCFLPALRATRSFPHFPLSIYHFQFPRRGRALRANG